MTVKELTCPRCNASVSPLEFRCKYCGAYYIVENNTATSPLATDEQLKKWLLRVGKELMGKGTWETVSKGERFDFLVKAVHVIRDSLEVELSRKPTIAEVEKNFAELIKAENDTS